MPGLSRLPEGCGLWTRTRAVGLQLCRWGAAHLAPPVSSGL